MRWSYFSQGRGAVLGDLGRTRGEYLVHLDGVRVRAEVLDGKGAGQVHRARGRVRIGGQRDGLVNHHQGEGAVAHALGAVDRKSVFATSAGASHALRLPRDVAEARAFAVVIQ